MTVLSFKCLTAHYCPLQYLAVGTYGLAAVLRRWRGLTLDVHEGLPQQELTCSGEDAQAGGSCIREVG